MGTTFLHDTTNTNTMMLHMMCCFLALGHSVLAMRLYDANTFRLKPVSVNPEHWRSTVTIVYSNPSQQHRVELHLQPVTRNDWNLMPNRDVSKPFYVSQNSNPKAGIFFLYKNTVGSYDVTEGILGSGDAILKLDSDAADKQYPWEVTRWMQTRDGNNTVTEACGTATQYDMY